MHTVCNKIRSVVITCAVVLAASATSAQTPPYQSNIDTTANWLANSATRSTGAILLTANDARINPYFANIGATGLTRTPAHYATVQNWINWYLAHLNRSGDVWGLGDTIYDYVVDAGGNEVVADNPPSADSTDSYAATFLSLVWAYYNTGDPGAQAFVRGLNEADLDGIAQVIVKTQKASGLTIAKPDYHVEYLMDNSEAYRGLRDAASLFLHAFNDTAKANTYNGAADSMLHGIQSALWNAGSSPATFYKDINFDNGVPDPINWSVWYPDSPSQLFPVALGVISTSDPHAGVYTTFNQKWPNWPTLSFQSTGETYPWCIIAYAAALFGDATSRASVNTYINTIQSDYVNNNFTGRPGTSQTWSVSEAGYFIRVNDLMLNGAPPPPPGISVVAPGANAQVTSPIPFDATATSSNGSAITSMKVFLDTTATQLASFSGNGTSSLSAAGILPTAATGAHTLLVTATDASGGTYQTNVPITLITTGGISIAAPGNNAMITGLTPFNTTATSTTNTAITAMKVYLDFSSTPAATFPGDGVSTSLHVTAAGTVAAGTHTLIVNAWDAGGKLYQSSRSITVLSSGGITVSNPANGSSPTSPVAYSASVASTNGLSITAVNVYEDFNSTPVGQYTTSGTNVSVSGSFPMSQATHTLITNAWDSAGNIYQSAATFTVSTSSFGGAPSTANTLQDMGESASWTACPGCSGNNPGGDAAFESTQVLNDSTSQDGNVRQFAINTNSTNFTGFLWYSHFSSLFATNWVLDYYVKVTDPGNLGSIEIDGNQTSSDNSDNYVFGTECNYGANPFQINEWRFWNGSTWWDSQLPCAMTTAGHWYHVQMHFNIVAKATWRVDEVRVTDATTGAVLTDTNLAHTLSGVGADPSHGNGIDVQLDGVNNNSYSATYDRINVIRW